MKERRNCERCGNPRPEHSKITFDKIGARDIGWITLRAGSGYQRDVDLCERCLLELRNWMSNDSVMIPRPKTLH